MCSISALILCLIYPGELPGKSKTITLGSSYMLHSEILKEDRRINIYLPPGYAESKKSYPVLYLLDGGVKEDFIHITGIASLAADWRKIRPFIVVGIEGINRYHDMSHPTRVKEEQKRVPQHGGAADFRKFLGKELQPYIKKHLRVTEETVLIGESMAGLFVAETLLRQPDLFQGYIVVSPSLWWDKQSLAKEAATLIKTDYPSGRRIYMTIADEGGTMQDGVDKVVEALKKHGPKDLVFTYDPMHHETHATIFHPAALRGVRMLFATTSGTRH